MYILECIDGSYYTGSTNNLELRLAQHQAGEGADHTKKRLPVKLVYYEEFQRVDEAFYREKQVQGWSRKKKEALINGEYGKLPELSVAYRDIEVASIASATSPNKSATNLNKSATTKLPEALEGNSKGWEIKRLEDVCETGAGGTPLKNHKEYYENGNIPWLRSGEVCKRDITDCELYISEEGLNNSSVKLFPTNTVLIAMYGATAGQVGILRFECSTNQAVCGILPNDSFIPEFLYYKFLAGKETLVKQAVGGAQPNISQIKIKNTLIPIPPLPEQKRIVSILDRAFAMVEALETKAKQNLKNAKELFESYLQGVFDPSTRSGQEGDDWEEKSFNELSTRIGDGLHGTPKYDKNGDYYFINGNNLNDGKIEIKENTKKVNKAEFEKYKKGLTKNTVLISINGTLGKVAFYNGEPVILGKSACYINFKDDVNKHYIKYLVKSPLFFINMASQSTGATIKNFSLKSMRNYTLPLPSLKEQKQIVQKLDALSAETKKLEAIYQQKIDDLEELKKSILQKAFNGELTMSEP